MQIGNSKDDADEDVRRSDWFAIEALSRCYCSLLRHHVRRANCFACLHTHIALASVQPHNTRPGKPFGAKLSSFAKPQKQRAALCVRARTHARLTKHNCALTALAASGRKACKAARLPMLSLLLLLFILWLQIYSLELASDFGQKVCSSHTAPLGK